MADGDSPIAVVGDVTVDWTIVTAPEVDTTLQMAYLWGTQGTAPICAMAGGAALISGLLSELGVANTLAAQMTAAALADPREPSVARTYTAWSTFPAARGSSEGRWRLREFLGQVSATKPALPAPVPKARVVVIDDSDPGLRGAKADWATILPNLASAQHVVVRMASKLASGTIWDYLAANCGPKVTLVCTLGDLRKEDAAVGQALSWERTASETVAAVRARPEFRALRRVVVPVGLAGAVIVEAREATLVYDSTSLEGDWEVRYPGTPFGGGAALVAAIAAALDGGRDIADGVADGLSFGRVVHERGLEVSPAGTVRIQRAPGSSDPRKSYPLATQHIPQAPDWTLLSGAAGGGLFQLANEALLRGIEDSTGRIPIERMGAWTSVDRTEIEGIRSVRNIVREYLQQRAPRKPLSIAVFGPPGSGKSFAIKEMTAELSTGSRALRTLEFNLSQFESLETLAAAFQQIRDSAVEGVLPLVFWDEFDTPRARAELGWLASFLAPMQDGVFLDGATARPIGPALFVFAGGTHASMASFKERAPEVQGAKATDFASRLRGFIDVRGPNSAGAEDDSFVIRRALLLRQILARRAPQLFRGAELDIDAGVAGAFLQTERYLHGARSMEAVVEMSALRGRTRFGRSSLPARSQLELHVDAGEFLSRI